MYGDSGRIHRENKEDDEGGKNNASYLHSWNHWTDLLVAAIVCGVSGNFPMMGLYLVLAGVFLYSVYATWKKEKDGKGGR